MKGGTVQINWHDTKPVLTLDFHPISGLLATGGADFDIKLWLINSGQVQKNIPTASYQNSLSYHGSAVNALRFSPSGEQLASGADGGELIIWKLHTTDTGQSWKVFKSLSFHRKDVLDLQWSTDGAFLISGSVDNSCIIWDVNKGSVHQILDGHFHYVQGVAWDPLSKHVASLSSDRTCRIYINKPQTKTKGVEKLNYICQHTIVKAEQQPINDAKSVKNHLFHDETLPSFFRRLAWSPDGSFLLVPAGSYKTSASSETINTTYVFSRKDLSRPSLQLPGASKPVVAVRFCPLAFNLQGSNPAGFFKLPYRLVFAIATLNSLYIYDTESVPPIAILAGLHYAAITDIAWSYDACYLALSSQDGYCTLVEFEKHELGLPISLSEPKIMNVENKSLIVQKPDDMVIEVDDSVTTDNRKTECVERREGKQAVENKRPIVQKPDDMVIEVDDSVTTDNRKTECVERREGKQAVENKRSIVQKPDDMVIEVDDSVTTDNRKTECAERREGKQASPSLVNAPISNKPAKRRITPMAIDP